MTFARYIFWTLGIALKLSAVRWIQMIMDWPRQQEWGVLLKTLWMGYRFDLLIVGFWLSPLVLGMLLMKVVFKKGLETSKLAKGYLLFSWLFICALYFRDLIYFRVFKEHMWLEDHQDHPFLAPEVWAHHEWWSWLWIGLITWGLWRVGAVRFDRWLLKLKNYSFASAVLILLWTAFIARGSLGSDHLRRNDCDWAKNRTIKSLCMNPVYTFSKNR